MPSVTEIENWKGQTLAGPDGDKIGKIGEIYLDDRSGQPEWALVNTGLFGMRSSFVPITDATTDGDTVTVPFDKATIKDAPNVDTDGHLSPEEEAELYRHYGRTDDDHDAGSAVGTVGSGTGSGGRDEPTDADRTAAGGGAATRDGEARTGTVGHDTPDVEHATSGPTTDDAMTRSEEELRVGTQEREVGRVRLRKHVVTENVTTTVPVSHEEVRLEREPITDQNRSDALDGPAISEEEHEVTLHAEEPVVQTDVVAKERVRLDKDVVQDEVQVSDEVRKERIDTDTDGDVDRRGTR